MIKLEKMKKKMEKNGKNACIRKYKMVKMGNGKHFDLYLVL